MGRGGAIISKYFGVIALVEYKNVKYRQFKFITIIRNYLEITAYTYVVIDSDKRRYV